MFEGYIRDNKMTNISKTAKTGGSHNSILFFSLNENSVLLFCFNYIELAAVHIS